MIYMVQPLSDFNSVNIIGYASDNLSSLPIEYVEVRIHGVDFIPLWDGVDIL